MRAVVNARGWTWEQLEQIRQEKAGYLYSQYHFYDIYQNSRYADFVLENNGRRIAIEIDDEGSHHKSLVASGKFYDDLLKQNSMIYMDWDVYRWAVRQMQLQPELVKDELQVFLGSRPQLREIEDYLPTQRGRALYGANLELKEHQREALNAKRLGGRTLFLAHTQKLVEQAVKTFQTLWSEVEVGR